MGVSSQDEYRFLALLKYHPEGLLPYCYELSITASELDIAKITEVLSVILKCHEKPELNYHESDFINEIIQNVEEKHYSPEWAELCYMLFSKWLTSELSNAVCIYFFNAPDRLRSESSKETQSSIHLKWKYQLPEQAYLDYTQLFQQLYYQADVIHGGRLPVHVHFLMDEFANVALPDEFDKLLSTMRSREISVSIIIQNLAQLKALFEKQWESIVGNCDEFLYLGGNEQSTHEYVSKLLGKETIDTNTYGQSKGRNGSYSTNWQLAGRELMTPDEVRMLDNRYALLFIRGERPVEDLKFDILKHPNIALTADGGAEPYRHGEDSISIAALSIDEGLLKKAGAEPVSEDEYLFFCEEELEELLQKKTEEKQHEQENQEQD